VRLAIDTNVLVSHLQGTPVFGEASRRFLAWAVESGQQLLVSDVVYAELFAWAEAEAAPERERRLRDALSGAGVQLRFPDDPTVPEAAGRRYGQRARRARLRAPRRRILPDFMIGAHAEHYADAFVTWNPKDFRGLDIPVQTPREVIA